jgi:hypothetical protein
LRYADRVGIHALVEEMTRLADQGESRFTPCDLLRQMAQQKRTFYPPEARI